MMMGSWYERITETLMTMVFIFNSWIGSAVESRGSVQDAPTLAEAQEPLLHRTHEKLFQIFFPVDELDLTSEQKSRALELKNQIWERVKGHPKIRNGLSLLATSPFFYSRETEKLTEVFYERFMDSETRNYLRSTAAQLRALYLILIYESDLAREITGYKKMAPPALNPDAAKIVSDFQRNELRSFDHQRLKLNPATREIHLSEGEFDYVIVGSGPAGTTLAHTLRGRGKKVFVLERGSFPVPGAVEPERMDAFLEANNRRTSTSGSVIIRNANAVGGGTTVNVDLAFSPNLPTVAQRWAEWRKNHLVDPQLFSPERIRDAYDWVVKAIGTRRLSESEINSNNRVLWEGSQKLGWPAHLYDLNRYQPGQKPNQYSQKISALTALMINDLRNSRNPLFLEPDADVRGILWSADQTRALGVRFRKLPLWVQHGVTDLHGLQLVAGQDYVVKAKNVILAAGSLGSATLLLREGLQKSFPTLGRGIVLHPSIPVIAEFERRIDIMTGLTASVYNDHFALTDGFILESMSAPPEYGAVMFPGTGREIFDMMKKYPYLGGFGVMLIDNPSKENKIRLNSASEPEIDYELSAGDRVRMRKGLKVAVQIAFSAGAKQVSLPTIEPRNSEGRRAFRFAQLSEALAAIDQIHFVPNKTILTSAHLQGSVKMGTGPKDSVVDHRGKVWGKANLYVIDSSVFPTSVGANPMQSIYMMSRILAEALP